MSLINLNAMNIFVFILVNFYFIFVESLYIPSKLTSSTGRKILIKRINCNDCTKLDAISCSYQNTYYSPENHEKNDNFNEFIKHTVDRHLDVLLLLVPTCISVSVYLRLYDDNPFIIVEKSSKIMSDNRIESFNDNDIDRNKDFIDVPITYQNSQLGHLRLMYDDLVSDRHIENAQYVSNNIGLAIVSEIQRLYADLDKVSKFNINISSATY